MPVCGLCGTSKQFQSRCKFQRRLYLTLFLIMRCYELLKRKSDNYASFSVYCQKHKGAESLTVLTKLIINGINCEDYFLRFHDPYRQNKKLTHTSVKKTMCWTLLPCSTHYKYNEYYYRNEKCPRYLMSGEVQSRSH